MRERLSKQLKRDGGILRLKPVWVTRTFLPPGRRLKLDPRDLYQPDGAVCERWFGSTIGTNKGVKDEGLSFIVLPDGLVSLKDAISEAGDLILGERAMERYGGLHVYSKFFDFLYPIPFHLHLMEKDAAVLGLLPKSEAYYFPRQMNQIEHHHAFSYFGLLPGTTKEDIRRAILDWNREGDNGILELSRAFRIAPGDCWDIPAGILHSPGSLVTFEVQQCSNVSCFMQSRVYEHVQLESSLYRFVPEEEKNNVDYLLGMIDWEANLVPDFRGAHKRKPVPVKDKGEMRSEGYEENWVVYNPLFSAKELRVFPGQSAVIPDIAAYDLLAVEGHGSINGMELSAPVMIRKDQLTSDEVFVTRSAAERGVVIDNPSLTDELVLLKTFGPDNGAALGSLI